MSRKFLLVAVPLLLSVMLAAPSSADSPAASAAATPAPLHLRATTFTPAAGEQPAVAPGLTIAGYAAGQRGYWIVQFAGPVQQAWKDQVTATGAEVLDYLPDFAFKVRMTPAVAADVEALGTVAWVGLFHPAYKVSPTVDVDAAGLVRVRVERGADAGLAVAAVRSTGATVLQRTGSFLLVAAEAGQISDVAGVRDVAWIENFVMAETHNEFGAGVIVGTNTAGYDGSTQIVAVSDTGLGDGTKVGAHADLAGRVKSIFNWPGSKGGCFQSVTDDGARDVDSGHGTHTSVSVLGDGDDLSGVGMGAAPAAELVFQATENWVTISRRCQLLGGWPANGYFLTGLPDDLRQMYQQAYTDGARIHSNSWGSSLAGEYTVDSANTDDFTWSNPDMLITFSAGNEGVDVNSPNGVVDDDSIGSPATAKNVLTVGASEGERLDNFPCDTGLTYTSLDAYQTGQTCDSMGGKNELGRAGERWGFNAEPLASDLSAGNAEQMAPFSSRGPTDDGRIKPDVVAPGTWILSGYSSMFQQGYPGGSVNPQNGAYQWDGWGMPYNSQYKYMGGTSMSNPIAAGAAAVVRDFYQKAHSHPASAALVKATLINSAVDLLDENNDGADNNDFPIPNVHEGWGRIDAANATDGSHVFVDEATGLSTGSDAVTTYQVTTGDNFKVTLVWSDFASTEAASANLVNDLDLVVTSPGGTTYRGNVFSGGWSEGAGAQDRVNNVENVYVQSAAAGDWTVSVEGYNVPNGPQPYALVVDGGEPQAGDAAPTVTLTAPTNGATVADATIDVTATASDDNGVTQVEFFVDDVSIGVNNPPTYSVSWDSTSVPDGSHTIRATATDTIGQTTSDTVTVTVDNVVETTMHVGDLDGSSTAANRGRWNASVAVTVHSGSEDVVSGASVTGTWSDGAKGSGSCVTTAGGQCTITKSNLKGNASSVTFTITNVTLSGSTYDASANHDPDVDSDGSTITVAAPLTTRCQTPASDTRITTSQRPTTPRPAPTKSAHE